MVVVAVLVLNIFHPGWTFREGYVPKTKKKFWKKTERTATPDEKAETGT